MSKVGVPRLLCPPIGNMHVAQYMGSEYWRKVRSIRPANLIAYWPLWEPSGAVAYDYSTFARHGANVALGARAAGSDGVHQAALFDGATSYVNVYSASLAAAFNGAEGTIIIWPKVYNVGVWTDTLLHWIIHFCSVDGNYTIRIYKDTSNPLVWLYYTFGVTLSVALSVTPTIFKCLGMTWSKSNDRMRAFYNGLQTGVDQTGMGVWVGALDATRTVVGAESTVPISVWYGYIAHGALWSAELSPSEMLQAAEV